MQKEERDPSYYPVKEKARACAELLPSVVCQPRAPFGWPCRTRTAWASYIYRV